MGLKGVGGKFEQPQLWFGNMISRVYLSAPRSCKWHLISELFVQLLSCVCYYYNQSWLLEKWQNVFVGARSINRLWGWSERETLVSVTNFISYSLRHSPPPAEAFPSVTLVPMSVLFLHPVSAFSSSCVPASNMTPSLTFKPSTDNFLASSLYSD